MSQELTNVEGLTEKPKKYPFKRDYKFCFNCRNAEIGVSYYGEDKYCNVKNCEYLPIREEEFMKPCPHKHTETIDFSHFTGKVYIRCLDCGIVLEGAR